MLQLKLKLMYENFDLTLKIHIVLGEGGGGKLNGDGTLGGGD